MTYATLQMLSDRVGVPMLVMLTDRSVVPTGEVDLAVLGRALADADALIDGFLAGKYDMPLTSTPALIADIAQAVTLWKLHSSEPETKVKDDYNDALQRLKEIRAGIIVLTDVAGLEPTGKAANGVQIVDRDRPFTEANMKGFI
jgi:phage gp36-like protein